MARVKMVKPEKVDDPIIQEIFDWVTQIEGGVPNHFYIEMNFPEFFKAKLGATKALWQMGELRSDEILYVGIAVSKANGCSYCTGAFCTILSYGFKTDEETVKKYVVELTGALADERTRTIVEFALKVNADPAKVTDDDIAGLRRVELTDKGIVQLCHLVGDFASYNRLNIALQTDYDYSILWRQLAFGDNNMQKAG
ncbi:MAG: carboxymuconolactone decarboxylase family protein [Terriglobales bacterium]